MIIPDKKKAVTVILSRMNGEGKSSDYEGKPEHSFGGKEELHAIADDLIAGVKEGSPQKVAMALEAAFNCLEMQPHEENEEPEQEWYCARSKWPRTLILREQYG